MQRHRDQEFIPMNLRDLRREKTARDIALDQSPPVRAAAAAPCGFQLQIFVQHERETVKAGTKQSSKPTRLLLCPSPIRSCCRFFRLLGLGLGALGVLFLILFSPNPAYAEAWTVSGGVDILAAAPPCKHLGQRTRNITEVLAAENAISNGIRWVIESPFLDALVIDKIRIRVSFLPASSYYS
jgi:hypothetical protein